MEFTYNEKKNYGTFGDDKNFYEVSYGHYNNYGDKLYIQSKYNDKDGSVKNGRKSIAFTKTEAEQLLPLLQQFVEEN